MSKKTLPSWVFVILLGVGLSAMGWIGSRMWRTEATYAGHARGTYVTSRTGTMAGENGTVSCHAPIVSYRVARTSYEMEGRCIESIPESYFENGRGVPGAVQLRYRLDRPSDAVIDSIGEMHAGELVLSVPAGLFAIGGFAGLAWKRARSRRRKGMPPIPR
jgi:hypothetical protein